ncbi:MULTISPECIES: hypothetical protein [unclassified Leifsonia]|uniref:hypothetical protein n=1 Tax=unclassified Leifsonia TaxID=2663824 RepID=UPI00035C741C|nr:MULTISPECIES: hypothetical protein [unclassified Leifsonia]
MLQQLVWASCATAPPSGQECNDTVALTSPTPPWLPLAILGAFIVVGVVVTLVRTRSRQRS